MYKDGSASVAHSLLLLLAHRHKQSNPWTVFALLEKADLMHRRNGSCICTAFASLEKADLTHRRNGSCISPEPAAPNPLRLWHDSHNFENERFRERQACGKCHNKPSKFLIIE